jgi:type II secretion system protein N
MKTRSWIGYALYGILVTIIFLYWCFPTALLQNYIVSEAAEANPNIVLSVGNTGIAFPPALKIENLVVRLKKKAESTFEADILTVRPSLRNFVSKRSLFLIMARLYNGSMLAHVNFKNHIGKESPVSIDLTLDSINIGKCSYVSGASGRQIEGFLTGSATFDGQWVNVLNGTGNAVFSLRNGSIRLLKPVFGFDTVAFDMMEGSMDLKNRVLKINTVNVAGKQINGSLKGTIHLRKDITKSILALTGNLEMPGLNRSLSVSLRGTIANPIPRFI